MQHINPERTILFAGAGTSISLGLPSWEDLINEIGRQLNFDARIFRLYGNYLSLAEYYRLKKGSIGPLRSWMDVQWHNGVDITKSELHKIIVKARFRKIYTTNFDRWFEKSCDHWKVPYRKILTVNDIAATGDRELEIVKFHGDFDDDKSLVLTESSYFERLDFQTPLDLMLRADVLRYSLLFVGYSLSDINIRYLFHKLAATWKNAPNNSSRPRSYIFMMRPNPIDERVFREWGIIPIVNKEEPATGLKNFLKRIKTT